MIDAGTVWIVPLMMFLVDWSIRWGVVLAALVLWFALRPPRRAATRHAVCAAGLAVGLLLPLVPRWGSATIVWPAAAKAATGSVSRQQTGSGMPPERALESVIPTRPGERPASADVAFNPVPSPRVAPRAPGRDAGLLAAWAVAVIWAGTVTILTVRLLGGWLLLARLRAGASEAGESSRMLLGECRKSLRLSRHAELAVHPAVASPVTLGGLRPLVLLPPDWDAWPESHRRACLLHELAHLARHDDWAKLVQEVVRIPFFFHPLVRWLLLQLDREREILCDEAVVVRGTEAVAYARLLLTLARRPGRVLAGAAALRPGWLPFLDRRTVAVRIERLLEKDIPHTLAPVSPRRLFALGAVALAAALGAGSLRVRTVEAQERPKRGNTETATAKAEPVNPPSRTITGVILDAEGNPASGAVVVGGRTDTGTSNHQVFTTDTEGRFSWPIPAGDISVSLFAHKPGLAVATTARWLAAEKTGDVIELGLGKANPGPFAAVLVDRENRPVAGARVRVEMLALNRESKLPGGGSSWLGTAFFCYHREILAGSPLEPLLVTTTDEHGAFSFRSFGPDSWLRLAVTSPDGREMRVKARTKADGAIGTMMDEQGFVAAPAGKETQLVIAPAARVQGRVATMLPGVSVSGLPVFFQASRVREELSPNSSNFGGVTRTDADGRFTFDGLNEGTINILLASSGKADAPWTYRAAQDLELRSGQTKAALIELIRGVEVEGKVFVQPPGQPLKGANIGVYGPCRPRSGAATQGATTDAEGRYHYRLPPGETYFYVMGHPPGVADRTVIIPDGAVRFEVPPIVVGHLLIVRGRVTDAAGRPVSGATVVCVGESGRIFGEVDAATDSRGEFQLPGNPNNSIPIGKPARLLIRLRDGSEHEVTAVPAADGSVAVKLGA